MVTLKNKNTRKQIVVLWLITVLILTLLTIKYLNVPIENQRPDTDLSIGISILIFGIFFAWLIHRYKKGVKVLLLSIAVGVFSFFIFGFIGVFIALTIYDLSVPFIALLSMLLSFVLSWKVYQNV